MIYYLHGCCSPETSNVLFWRLDNRIRRIHQNAALACTAIIGRAAAQTDVALLSPGRAPGVLDLVVIVAAVAIRSVADCEYPMIQARTAGPRHHTAAVKLEGVLVGFHCNRDGLLGNRGHERRVRVRRHIDKGGDRRARLLGLLAGAVDALVGIDRLSRDPVIVDDVLEGVVHEAAVAALVALGARAVNELLFRETDQRLVGQKVRAFNGSGSGESPAGAALALILDGRDGAVLRPIDRGG